LAPPVFCIKPTKLDLRDVAGGAICGELRKVDCEIEAALAFLNFLGLLRVAPVPENLVGVRRSLDLDRVVGIRDANEILVRRRDFAAPDPRVPPSDLKLQELMQEKAHDLRLWLDLVTDPVAKPSEPRIKDVLPAGQHKIDHLIGLEGMGRNQFVGFRQPLTRLEPVIG